MKKKKSGGGGANWMDTYGDMVTLLLCFFVLLYSMSTISEEKWRAIVTSFNPFAQETPTETGGTDGPVADPADDSQGGYPAEPDVAAQRELDEIMEDLFLAFQQIAGQEGMESSIQVEMSGGKIYVKFSDTVFFDGDSFDLRPEAEGILLQVCECLNQASDAIEEIQIQGHTAQGSAHKRNDVEFDRFLSSNRATEVLVFLQLNSDIHPARLVGAGMGQWRPISSNETPETRQYNRRVEMVISGRDLKAEELGEALSTSVTRDEEDMNQQTP